MKKLSLIIFLISSLSCVPAAWCQKTGNNPDDARIYAFIGEQVSVEKLPVDTADKEKYDKSLIERVERGRMMRRLYESYIVKFKIIKPISNDFEADTIELVVTYVADGNLRWKDQKYTLVTFIKSPNGRYYIHYHSDEVFQDTEENWFSIFNTDTTFYYGPRYTKLEPNYLKLKPENKFKIPIEVYSHLSAKENIRYQKLRYPRQYYSVKVNEYAIPKYGISAVDLFAARKLEIYKHGALE
jgi:hypothetical protein